jgi:3-phenylpropionate/trans-cinnamate dioxygenase ferredoxin subunit
MEFFKVIDTTELPENTMVKLLAGGKEILLANVEGSYYAIAHKCTHLGGPLSKGALDGSTITCPWHGAQFDVKTGKAVGVAKIAFVKMQVKDVASYPVKVEGTTVLVGIA